MSYGKISKMLVDATNLEINSILVEGISGRKMPGIVPAFLETMSAWVFQFEDLKNKLTTDRFKVDLKHPFIKATKKWNKEKKRLFNDFVFTSSDFTAFAKEPLVTSVLDIDAMNSFRKAMTAQMRGKPNAEEYNAELFRLLKMQSRLMVLNRRFTVSCREQKDVINKKYDLRDIQELRKLWELKDGYIYAQNIVQLDGDIVSRSNLRMYRDRRIKNNVATLLDFHRKNVDTGIQHWHFIVETIKSIAGAVSEKLGNPFK